jgi:hypothetical protein
MSMLSKIVEGSSHSDADPQLIVIVLTPSGDAELTLLKVVLCLRPVTYEAWGSNPYAKLPTRGSNSGPPDDSRASMFT